MTRKTLKDLANTVVVIPQKVIGDHTHGCTNINRIVLKDPKISIFKHIKNR